MASFPAAYFSAGSQYVNLGQPYDEPMQFDDQVDPLVYGYGSVWAQPHRCSQSCDHSQDLWTEFYPSDASSLEIVPPYWGTHAALTDDLPLLPPPLASSEQPRIAYRDDYLPIPPVYQTQDTFCPERSSSLWGALDLPPPALAVAGSDADLGSLAAKSAAKPKTQQARPRRIRIPSAVSSPGEADEPSTAHTDASSPSKVARSPYRWQEVDVHDGDETSPKTRKGRKRSASTHSGDKPERKAALLACQFCRGRKIACGGPPSSDAENTTCRQCSRRNLVCVYPNESHRGVRRDKPEKQRNLGSGSTPPTPVGTSATANKP